MSINTQLPEADIRKLIDEYLASGYSLKDFCLVAEQDEAQMQTWLDQYPPEEPDSDNPFYIGNLMKEGVNLSVIKEQQKPAPKKQQVPALFAKVGDIELYHQVSAAYLKSLKG